MSALTDILPASIRRRMYLIYGLMGISIGAAQAGISAAQIDQPKALTVVLAVYAYLGIALGLTAAANTDQPPKVRPRGQHMKPPGPYDTYENTE